MAATSLICELLKAHPPIWNYPEFEKYINEHSKGAATELINKVIKQNAGQVKDVKKLVSYMAERPGVEKIGKHGLFSQTDDKIDLDKVCAEVENHNGIIWTHIVTIFSIPSLQQDFAKVKYVDYVGKILMRAAAS